MMHLCVTCTFTAESSWIDYDAEMNEEGHINNSRKQEGMI